MSTCLQQYVHKRLHDVECQRLYFSAQTLHLANPSFMEFECLIREDTEEHIMNEVPQGIARPWLLPRAATSAPLPPSPASVSLHCQPPVSNVELGKAATPGMGFTTCRTQTHYGLLKRVEFTKVSDCRLSAYQLKTKAGTHRAHIRRAHTRAPQGLEIEQKHLRQCANQQGIQQDQNSQ